MSDQCNGCSLEHMAEMITNLRAEIAHLRMYAPARRAAKNTEPAKQIAPTNWKAWGMIPPEECSPPDDAIVQQY